ncbi:MAG: amidase [Actinobacteria bacterium]|nr:amidase [Actinomycetota bacterium]
MRPRSTALVSISVSVVSKSIEDLPLHFRSARELRDLVLAGELSATELTEAHLARVEAVDPEINAIVTLVPDRALAEAAELDARLARGEPPGLLHGLPVAVKDLMDTAGIRTTYGSPIYADHVPDRDALIVTRLRAAGAVVIGKTNTPEFGAGSHTFNEVFGATRNPYDPRRSAGGSSGGAAAALAAGMVPIADGSDLGGSVRNPGSFCNVVGLRPSPGRVASTRPGNAWDPMSLLGPMARTVDDAALLLAAIAGPDPRAPLSLTADPTPFASLAARPLAGARIAWSDTVDGLPIDPAVTAALAPARERLEAAGVEVVPREPDLRGADQVFETFRAFEFFAAHGAEVRAHPELTKPEVRQDVEWGAALGADQLAEAGRLRTELFRRVGAFVGGYDALALPTVQLPPFPVEWRHPETVAGVEMERYYTWMRSCTRISATNLPAISVPASFTEDGLPVGLQLVGVHNGELALLELAAAIEAELGASSVHPQ